ncbi:MAG: 3'-5' exonuclease [Candidatus Obscuribacterales bacterium]|nr:3'-5' exonuclease [Candidatus Obscuribacterales bacterium]
MSSILVPENVVIVDVEGNGQSPPDIVEIAILQFGNGIVEFGNCKNWLLKPPKTILRRVSEIHGITNKMVANCQCWDDIKAEVIDALKDNWIVAHNARVEYDVLCRHLPNFEPFGFIDTLRFSRTISPTQSSHSLDSLLDHFSIVLPDTLGPRHRASCDVFATALVFQALMRESVCHSWEGLCKLACDPKLPSGLGVRQEKLF